MELKGSLVIAIVFTGTVVLWPGSGHSQARDLVTELGGAPRERPAVEGGAKSRRFHRIRDWQWKFGKFRLRTAKFQPTREYINFPVKQSTQC